MRSVLLPACVQLRPKSLEIFRDIGVEVVHGERGWQLNFLPGVGPVVSCVLKIERNLPTNREAGKELNDAIVAADQRWHGASARAIGNF